MHLPPILFSLFVNSVRIALPFCKLLFYRRQHSTDDCLSLQNSLDCFSNWCNSIGLKINASKYRVMTFTRSRTPILCDNHISGIKILRVINNVVDLGFRLTGNLIPCPHISMISSRAFNVLGFMIHLSIKTSN